MLRRTSVVITTTGASGLTALSPVSSPTFATKVLDVPFTQFATDLATGALPDYVFIVPDLCNDAHDCPLRRADSWLKNNIDPLVRSTTFQEDGLLLLLFDESGRDHTHGGGRIACVIVSPKARRRYQSTTFYQHQSLLRLSLKALGVTAFPNAAASAPDMDEFFEPTGLENTPRVATALHPHAR